MDKAFGVLAGNYRTMLLAYIRTLVGDHHLAEDLIQETLLAAHTSFDRFEEGADFGAWLRGIARNCVRHSKRSAGRQRVIANDDIMKGIEDIYTVFDKTTHIYGFWDETLDLVRKCAGKLGGKLRQAVVEVYYRGRTIREAADALSASYQSVGQRLSRGRVLIKQCVERHLERNSHA